MGIPPSRSPRRASSTAVFSMARYFSRFFSASVLICTTRVPCLNTSFGGANRRKHPAQEQVGRPIDKRDGSNKNHGKVRRGRSPGAMKERILIHIVHIVPSRQKARGDEKTGGNRPL